MVAATPSSLPATDAELQAALRTATGCEVLDWQAAPSPYSTSFPLHDVEVTTPRGLHRFVLKDLRWTSLSAAARRAERLEGHDPRRELATYRHLLADTDGPPRLHAGVVEPRSGRAWLLLEHVSGGRELYQWGDLAAWTAAAAWLAGFHRTWAEPARLAVATRRVPLRRHDLAHLRHLGQRAASRRDGLPQPVRHGWSWASQVLASCPRTVVHGECYASDVLVSDAGRVAVLDWETTALGTGWEDLAALVTGWDAAGRDAMLEAYLRALPPALRPRDPELVLDAARVGVCIQWLGADPGWLPPHEHRRDWLAEATALCLQRNEVWR